MPKTTGSREQLNRLHRATFRRSRNDVIRFARLSASFVSHSQTTIGSQPISLNRF